MKSLTGVDAGFLHAEDADRHMNSATGTLAVLDGPAPDDESLLATVAAQVARCPRLAQRIQPHPLDLSAPRWVADARFDVGHHVRRIALPRPGDDAALHRAVADVMARRLDRDRPLWELWVIEGLRDNRWAILTKVHSCMADGVAATHMLVSLCDDDATGADAGRAAPTTPASWPGALWSASTSIAADAVRIAWGAVEIALDLARPAPHTALRGPVSSLRRYSTAQVGLRDVMRVCEKFDVSIDDVALAAVTEAYRAMMIRRGEEPRPDSLRALMPTPGTLPLLPVDEENPLRRLKTVQDRVDRAKSHGRQRAGSALVSIANRLPFPVTAHAVRLLARIPQRGLTTLAAGIAGPSGPRYLMGREVVSLFPVPALAMNMRTGVTTLSYAGGLFFGVLADHDTVPDVDALARDIELAVARLAACSRQRRGAADRGALILVKSA